MSNKATRYCICVGPCAQGEIWEGKRVSGPNGKQRLGTVCQITRGRIELFKPKYKFEDGNTEKK